ncbi:MAG: flagellar hook capping FlgD N-terminal domain-containing protein [Angelakisella sp.]|nr:flagellar hook capping FlgD N-terminal domain-containing protein [Angelakisella sp.]
MDGITGYNSNQATKTGSKGNSYDAVFTDKKENMVSVQDFLNLMVAQLANQDFMNPVDDTQYVAQLAQFATMQQMQELASYSKSNYVMSLIGQDVTVAKFTVSGNVEKVTGPVEKVSLIDNEYTIYVKGKPFTLDQIMELGSAKSSNTELDTSKLAISVKEITENSVEFTWPKPETTQQLKYSVYYSENNDMDTVDDVEKNGLLIGQPGRENLTSESLKGLKADTTYFVNILVTDENGNKTIYQKSTFRTLAQSGGK